MSSPMQSGRSVEQRLREARDELTRLLYEGQACAAETILASWPALAAEPECALELIYAEFVARQEMGQPAAPDEYFQRFPQWRERIERLLKVHDALARLGNEFPDPAPDTPHSWESTCGDAPAVALPEGQPRRPVGPYELLEEVGSGGMGIVYRARQLALQRIVALKFIRHGAHASPQQRARFRAEAEAAARLQHPHIVQIYDVGEHDGCPYLAMEFVGGGSLESKLGDHTVPTSTAAQLVETLARAIHYAHQCGIVHRDLKPSNVLLQCDEGQGSRVESQNPGQESFPVLDPRPSTLVPKITDFGLAKHIEQFGTSPDTPDKAQKLTETGAVLGTPSYMAPEQTTGRNDQIGPPTDVYALGAILYKLLTGRPPFLGDSLLEILNQVQSQDPMPPTRLRAKLPRDLETISLKCLAKKPQDRYATAATLADDLRRWRDGKSIQARRAGRLERLARWCHRKPALASLLVTLAAVCLVGLSGILWQWQRAEHQATIASRHAAEAAEERARAQREQRKAVREQQRAEANLQSARDALERLTLLGEQLIRSPHMETTGQAVLEETLKFHERMLKQQRADPRMRFETALACMRAGNIQNQLGQREKSEASYRQATSILQQLCHEFPNQSTHRYQLARCYLDLAYVLRSNGNTREAEITYRSSIDLMEQLFADSPAAVEYRLTLAIALANWCTVQRGAEAEARIEKALQRAIGLQTDVLSAHPHHLWAQLDLSVSLEDLGYSMIRNGKRDRAEELLTQALNLRRQVASQSSELGTNHYYLARLLRGSAAARADWGEVELAKDQFREVIELGERLVAAFPRIIEHRRVLAATLADAGRFHEAQGYRDDGIAALERAAILYEDLVRDDRGDPRFPVELVRAYVTLEKWYQEAGQPALGDASWQKALLHVQAYASGPDHAPRRRAKDSIAQNTQRTLADRGYHAAVARVPPETIPHDQQTNDRLDRSRTLANMAQVLADAGRTDPADYAYAQAIAVCQQLAVDFPDQSEPLRQQAHHLAAQARFYEQIKRIAEAERAWLQAIQILDTLARPTNHEVLGARLPRALGAGLPTSPARALSAGLPTSPAYVARSDLALAYWNFAYFLRRQRRLPEAESSHRRSLAIREQLGHQFPLESTLRSDLAQSYYSLGSLLDLMDQMDEAERQLRTSIDLRQKLVDDFPLEPAYRKTLARSHYRLARVLQQRKQFQETLDHYRKSLEFHPDVAQTNNSCAWLLATCPDVTLRDPARAVALARRATELAPDDDNYWSTLAVALYRARRPIEALTALSQSLRLSRRGHPDGFLWTAVHGRLNYLQNVRQWFNTLAERGHDSFPRLPRR